MWSRFPKMSLMVELVEKDSWPQSWPSTKIDANIVPWMNLQRRNCQYHIYCIQRVHILEVLIIPVEWHVRVGEPSEGLHLHGQHTGVESTDDEQILDNIIQRLAEVWLETVGWQRFLQFHDAGY